MTTPTDTCPCGALPASACPGSWEPGCDLGNNPSHVAVAESPNTDAALGLVELPPIRISASLHAGLVKAAEARGVIVQALVRECLEVYGTPTPAATLRLVR